MLKSLKRSESEQTALGPPRGLIAKESETCRVCERTPAPLPSLLPHVRSLEEVGLRLTCRTVIGGGEHVVHVVVEHPDV